MSTLLRIRTSILLALAATVVIAPACDEGSDAELAARLGVSVEDLAEMPAEELDALDEDFDLDLTEEVEFTHHPRPLPQGPAELTTPIVFTHAELATLRLENRPRPTHEGVAHPADELAAPTDDSGCDTHGDDIELAAR